MPIPQRPPTPTAPAGSRAGRKGSPETPLRFRITPVRSVTGDRDCLKRCIYTTIECMHLLANAAGRRRSDGRGWTIRDESITPVREACSIPSLGHWVATECGDIASVPTLQGCTQVAPPPNHFFSYFLLLGHGQSKSRLRPYTRIQRSLSRLATPAGERMRISMTCARRRAPLSDSVRSARRAAPLRSRQVARTAMLPHTLVPPSILFGLLQKI